MTNKIKWGKEIRLDNACWGGRLGDMRLFEIHIIGSHGARYRLAHQLPGAHYCNPSGYYNTLEAAQVAAEVALCNWLERAELGVVKEIKDAK